MDTLLSLSIALLAGLLMSRLTKKIGLPDVTAYLVAGIIVGPCCLGMIGVDGLGFTSLEKVQGLSLVSNVALGFIAFAMGNEFRIKQLKEIGRQATVVAVFQAVTATVFVDVVLIVIHFIAPGAMPLEAAITLGAIAAATAPAATLMVVRQYKAEGPLTRMLLPVVALDDAVGLILFAVSFGIAQSLTSSQVNFVGMIAEPIVEILLSVALGIGAGFAFSGIEQFFHSNSKRLAISITFVMLTVAVSMIKLDVGGFRISFSPLLSCMMLGTVFCNVCDFSEELMERCDKWTAPLFVLFFVISGAELELGVIAKLAVVGVGIAYLAARSAGKYFGARISCGFTHCSPTVRKYLGVTLLPQAGVALGMTITAQQLPGSGSLIRNIVLFSVLVYEIIGPAMTKAALKKADEISPKPESVRNKAKTEIRRNK